MADVNVPSERKRHAVFAVHGISPIQRYAFLDQVAATLQSFLNAREDAAKSGHSWGAVVHWPRVAARDGETVRPTALRIYRNDRSPDDPHGITYDVYEGYWSPLSKGRTNFASALKWLLNSTFLATSSTANIPCTWEKLKSDLPYVAVLLGTVLAALLTALAVGLYAWAVFIRGFVPPPSGPVTYWALLENPTAALRLPFLAYVELGIDAVAAYVLAQLAVMHSVGFRRVKRTKERMKELSAHAKDGESHFTRTTIDAHAFHRDASVLLWIVFVVLLLAAAGVAAVAQASVHQLVGQPGGWHAVAWHLFAGAVVGASVLIFQGARSMANWAVENVLGDVQIYTTHDQNSGYYSIREQIVQTVSDALIAVLRATDTTGNAHAGPYYDSIHIFGHSLGSTVAMDVLIRLRQLLQEGTLADDPWKRIRSFTTFGTALEKTQFFFDVRHPTINAAQDQWENDVYGRFFTKDRGVLRDSDNSQGIYWSNLWYFRDIVANAIVSYQSDVSPGSSFVWTTGRGAREIYENYELKHPRPRLAWVHSDYLQDPLFWGKVGPIVAQDFASAGTARK